MPDPVVEPEALDIRGSLSEAFDRVEAAAAEPEGEPEPAAAAAEPEGEPEPAAAAAEPEGEPEPAAAAAAKPEGEPEPAAAAAADGELKAPASWSPLAREEWSKVPKSVQETIDKREKEVLGVMNESAQSRQHMANFNNMIQPFQGMFQAQGIQNPLQGIYNVLQMSARLQGGSPQDKAATMAGMIKQFGVNITDLDNAIVGNKSAAGPQQAGNDPRYDQLAQQVNGMQSFFTQQNQQQQDTITTETTAFLAANEFAPELRGVMADFMDMAAKQPGASLSLKEAYERAIATRPDIQQVLASRKKIADAGKHTQNARAAGVSVPINSNGGNAPAAPETLRDALVESWDSA